MERPFEIFLSAPPGLEDVLLGEVRDRGFHDAQSTPGGVRIDGGWEDVWRANVQVRGASRVLARIASFRAFHLAQLDKRSRRVDWSSVLRPDTPVRVEASCTSSRIYHAGAAAQRIERALREEAGAVIAKEAAVRILARIEDDLCTLSIDTSGAPLHKRGTKLAVGKASMRETLAYLFLRAAGYRTGDPVVDPMCGSGTFPLEAAGDAAGLPAGGHRAFAFEQLVPFDIGRFETLKGSAALRGGGAIAWGFDRDQGAIAGASANAERAGLQNHTRFACQPISALEPPCQAPGLLIANPPYGARIGTKSTLRSLYGSFGEVALRRFGGWRVAFITSEPTLARATGLPLLEAGPPVPNGGLKVRLYQSAPLP